MDEKQISDIALYTLKLIDQTISPKEFEEFNSILSSNAQAARHYNQFMMTVCSFQGIGKELLLDGSAVTNDVLQKEFWKSLAEYEKNAPVIECVPEKPQRELIQKVVYPPGERRKAGKFGIFLALNAAAILFLFLFLRFTPTRQSVQVATLTDSVNAIWAGESFEKGARIATGNEKLLLREGYAELLFDNQARVTIEGPAEFQILADDRINLNYGKVYSRVSREATGFSVYTQNSKIIDLGTEFGVEADFRGETRLHVIEGKIKLITGRQSEKTSVEVRQGEAKKISADTSKVSVISFKSDLFVRNIDSKHDFIWRGQTRCNLADIVGGGDGFGKGQVNIGIDHEGQTTLLDNIVAYTEPVPFTSVSSNPFVNGVFVPYGPTQIDSFRKDVYDFGSTSGKFYLGVLNGAWHKQKDNAVPRHALRLGGIEYGTPERPAIYIHANQGVTFDLQAIRDYTHMEITGFKSICGVSETYAGYAEAIRKVRQYQSIQLPKASFYVLVDGRERFVRKELTHLDGPAVIQVDIAAEDRFLTLVTTEGSDKNDGDWTLFGEPVLMMQSE